MIQYLVSVGADVNETDDKGRTGTQRKHSKATYSINIA